MARHWLSTKLLRRELHIKSSFTRVAACDWQSSGKTSLPPSATALGRPTRSRFLG